MKKILLLTILLILVVTSTAFAATKFSDLNGDEWYGKSAVALINNGLVKGFPDGTFRPKSNITVSQFIVIAVKTIDPTIEGTTGVWYKPYLDKAIEFGIVKEGEFKDLNAPITRGDMAKILVKALEYNGEVSVDASKYITMIGDYNTISAEYKPYILKAYAFGIMGGFPDGTFKPQNFATRADSSVMLNCVIDESARLVPKGPESKYLSENGIPLVNGKEAVKDNGTPFSSYGVGDQMDKYVQIRELINQYAPGQKIEVEVYEGEAIIRLYQKNSNLIDINIFIRFEKNNASYQISLKNDDNSNKELYKKIVELIYNNEEVLSSINNSKTYSYSDDINKISVNILYDKAFNYWVFLYDKNY